MWKRVYIERRNEVVTMRKRDGERVGGREKQQEGDEERLGKKKKEGMK